MTHRHSRRRPDSWRHLTAVVLGLLLCSSLAADDAGQGLTLAAAIARTLDHHPALRVYSPRLAGLAGRRLTADQSPAYEVGLDAENILGSGDLAGVEGGEYTLSLSSVIELGNKRQARVQVADSQLALVQAERDANALALLGEVTQSFVSALALQEKVRLAVEAEQLAVTALQLVEQRVNQAAAPEADLLRARAQLAQARLERAAMDGARQSSLLALAATLGAPAADFDRLDGDLYAFAAAEPFSNLFARANASPVMLVYASQERLRQAELQLILAQSRSDLSWQLGSRYSAEAGDGALIAGLSMPLFGERRNRGEVQAATAARDEVALLRDNALLTLRVRLQEAYSQHQQAVAAVAALNGEIVPNLRRAAALAQDAYQQGRQGYADWYQAQQQLLAAQVQVVDAASTALLNQALLEQLTAQPLAANQRRVM